MLFRIFCASLALCACLLAQTAITVQQLQEFIRSSVKQKQQDKEVAAMLRTLKLSERLDDNIIEDLQRDGAGPKTVAALKDLGTKSASLPAPKAAAPAPVAYSAPPPSAEDQASVLAEVRENALNYTKSLPDYICSQVTRRFIDPAGREAWHTTDVILARLTYFEQKEDYKLVSVNNNVTVDKAYTSVGGAISQGEFGSMLREIFEPKSKAEFNWARWGKLRGHVSYVFAYAIELANSQFTIHYQSDAADKGRTITVGYHGLLYVDKDTREVLRVTLHADNIPPDFPVHQSGETLDYDYINISGHEFLLPLTADFRSHVDAIATKNIVEFRNYRKFSADASIRFDETEAPPPLPEDKTKEQAPPPKP